MFAPVRYLSKASPISSKRIGGIRRVKTNLAGETEGVCQGLVEVRSCRMPLDARKNHERRTRYTIATMTRITSKM